MTKSTDWTTKEDAARKLGVSTRQIERLAAAGKIRSQRTRLPGERSDRTVYAIADIEGREGTRPDAQLASIGPAATPSALLELIARAITGAEPASSRARPRDWLTLSEAAQHSGLTEAQITQLAREGRVHSVGRGQQRRIQRASLDNWGSLNHAE